MNISIRPLTEKDLTALRTLLRAIGVFEEHEIRVAEELLEAALAGDLAYTVFVAERKSDDPAGESATGAVMGYVCYGLNPVTDALFDVYWIAVDPSMQRHGAGRALLSHAEACVPGSLQVPPSGRPIRFHADSPTTGGYPVIAVVEEDDLDLAAQLRPGQTVSFRPAS